MKLFLFAIAVLLQVCAQAQQITAKRDSLGGVIIVTTSPQTDGSTAIFEAASADSAAVKERFFSMLSEWMNQR